MHYLSDTILRDFKKLILSTKRKHKLLNTTKIKKYLFADFTISKLLSFRMLSLHMIVQSFLSYTLLPTHLAHVQGALHVHHLHVYLQRVQVRERFTTIFTSVLKVTFMNSLNVYFQSTVVGQNFPTLRTRVGLLGVCMQLLVSCQVLFIFKRASTDLTFKVSNANNMNVAYMSLQRLFIGQNIVAKMTIKSKTSMCSFNVKLQRSLCRVTLFTFITLKWFRLATNMIFFFLSGFKKFSTNSTFEIQMNTFLVKFSTINSRRDEITKSALELIRRVRCPYVYFQFLFALKLDFTLITFWRFLEFTCSLDMEFT